MVMAIPSIARCGLFCVACILPYRIMHGDELGAIRERGLDLDLMDHLGDTVHDIVPPKNLTAEAHDPGHALSVAPESQVVSPDNRGAFRIARLYPPASPLT